MFTLVTDDENFDIYVRLANQSPITKDNRVLPNVIILLMNPEKYISAHY